MSLRVTFVSRAAIERGLVLHALQDTGQTTAEVIAARIDRPLRRVRRALRVLHELSMVCPTDDGGAWRITRRGQEFVATAPRVVA